MKESTKKITRKAKLGTAVRPQGKARVSDILETAQSILVSKGLANLTIRSVADALGISVGNLVYYFPSKDALLQAIIEHVIEGYDAELEIESKTFPDDPRKRFIAFVRYLIEDAKLPEVRGFFYQFWGLSTHNARAAETRTEAYRHFSGQVVGLLGDIHTDKSTSALENMAFGIMACMEGLHVVYGSGDISRIHSPSFDKHIFKQVLMMAELADNS